MDKPKFKAQYTAPLIGLLLCFLVGVVPGVLLIFNAFVYLISVGDIFIYTLITILGGAHIGIGCLVGYELIDFNTDFGIWINTRFKK